MGLIQKSTKITILLLNIVKYISRFVLNIEQWRISLAQKYFLILLSLSHYMIRVDTH